VLLLKPPAWFLDLFFFTHRFAQSCRKGKHNLVGRFFLKSKGTIGIKKAGETCGLQLSDLYDFSGFLSPTLLSYGDGALKEEVSCDAQRYSVSFIARN
jgi:hypothetical protein